MTVAALAAVASEGDGLGLVYLVVVGVLLAIFGPIALLIGRDAKRRGRNGWAWGLLFLCQPAIVGVTYVIVRNRNLHGAATR